MSTADADRHAQMRALFVAAVDLDDAGRRTLLDERCAGDDALRRDVEALLAGSRRAADSDHPFADARLRAVRAQLEHVVSGSRDGASPGDLVGAGAPVPEMVGRYRIVRRIAAGGMGVVYEATQDAPRRRVALKLIPAHRATPERLRRFRQEAEVLGRLQHPGIAQIHEAGTFDLGDGAQPFFAMEYVDGVDVRTYADRAELDVPARLALMAEIADAVQHAHDHGVVHRDLKPDNVLVNRNGRAKVLDFGVARAGETSTAISTVVTHEGQIIGTLAYMAPEQLSADPELVTPRADVYALGVMLHELLTDRLPHDLAGLPTTAAIRVLTERDTPRIGRSHPALRGDIETIVGTALDKDTARRYASAAAFAADLRRHLDNHPIAARPPSRAYLARKFVRRHRTLVGGATATALTLVAGIVVAAALAHFAFDQRDLAAESATEARRNETTMAGAQLQATQTLLDADRPWDALRQHETIPPRLRGWCWHLLGRELPVEIQADQDGPVDSAWEFIDADHLVRPNPTVGALEIYSVPASAIVRVLPLGQIEPREPLVAATARRAIVWSESEARIVDLDHGTVLDRWPRADSTLFADGISDNGRVVLRMLPDARTELVVGGAVRRIFEGPQASRVRLAWHGRHVLIRHEEGDEILDVETGASRYRIDTSDRPGTRLSSFDGGFFVIRTGPRGGPIERFDFTDDGAVPNGVELHYTEMRRFTRDGNVLCDHGNRLIDTRTGAPWLASRFQKTDGTFPSTSGMMQGEFSPDGTRLCISGMNYRKPWLVDLDPREREPGFDPKCITLAGHTQWIYHVAVSNDGSLIASAAPEDPLVRIWDARTGAALATFARRTSQPASWDALLAFTNDDERLVMTTPTAEHPMAFVTWHLRSGVTDAVPIDTSLVTDRHLTLLDEFIDYVRPADGARLNQRAQMDGDTALALAVPAALHYGGPTPAEQRGGRRWRLAPGAIPQGRTARGLSIHPTERRVALACRRPLTGSSASEFSQASVGDLVIVDADTGAEILRQRLDHEPWCCAYSPDGAVLAVGAHDGTVTFFETEFYTRLLTLPAHVDPAAPYTYVYSLAWAPDGSRLVTVSGDRTVKIWDGRTTPASRLALTEWRDLRTTMAARPDLATAYDGLSGLERAAARVELIRRPAGARPEAD